jgi:hypothetical protein
MPSSRNGVLRDAVSRSVGSPVVRARGFSIIAPLSPEDEVVGMSNAETEQCKVDRFWGFDRESSDRAREAVNMAQQETESQMFSLHCNFQLQKKIWEADLEQQRRRLAIEAGRAEERERRQYLAQFFAST